MMTLSKVNLGSAWRLLLSASSIICLGIACAGCSDEDTATNGIGNNTPGEHLTIDHIEGLHAPDSVLTGLPIIFHIRLTNNTGSSIVGLTNGFRVFSLDGASWAGTIGTNSIDVALFDGGAFVNPFSLTGSGADTVGFGGFKLMQDGIPDGYSGLAFSIEIGPISNSYHGRTVCIDSAYYPPAGSWLWSLDPSEKFTPDWDGRTCFRIVNPSALAGSRDEP
ncbi:MAG: hypothetical protein ACE5FH_11635 [Candidatus Zixiibacteriota bacterium]